jgi:hypothetical protein
MPHSDKLKLVVAAIEAERSKTSSNGIIELRQTKDNKLNTVPINDILSIPQVIGERRQAGRLRPPSL